MKKTNLQNPTRYLSIITDLPLIMIILTDPGFGPRSMAYLSVLSFAIPVLLRTLIDVWYQSVGRQILNP